jgi:hypothetical protein
MSTIEQGAIIFLKRIAADGKDSARIPAILAPFECGKRQGVALRITFL